MTILPCLFPRFEDFHPLQFSGKVMRVMNIEISAGVSSLWYPAKQGLRAYNGLPTFEPQE